MNDGRHVIWSNDPLTMTTGKTIWRNKYPELSENERVTLMYEINGDYSTTSGATGYSAITPPFSLCGGLWDFWNGRRMGYKEIKRQYP